MASLMFGSIINGDKRRFSVKIMVATDTARHVIFTSKSRGESMKNWRSVVTLHDCSSESKKMKSCIFIKTIFLSKCSPDEKRSNAKLRSLKINDNFFATNIKCIVFTSDSNVIPL